MRVAVLSDLHISVSQRFHEGRRVHAWIAGELVRRAAVGAGPDLIVLAGDIYDRAPNPEEVMEAVRVVRSLGTVAPVLIIRGNHDPRHAIDVFACLEAPHPIAVYDKPAVHRVDGGAVAVLPWLDRVGPAPERRMTKDERARARGAALLEIVDRLAVDLLATSGVRLAVAHCAIQGAKLSTGQPLKKGQEFELALHELELLGAHAYLLGHIHLGQSWYLGKAPVFYAGSTIRTAFGEIEDKRFVMLHADAEGNVDVETVRTPAAAMLLAENTWTGQSWSQPNDALEEAVRAACAASTPGISPEVRYLFRVAPEHRDGARHAAAEVRAKLEAAGAIVTTRPVLTVEKAARCPEIASAPALKDKLGIFLEQVRDIPAEDVRALRVQDALAELEAALAIRTTIPTGGVHLQRLRLAGLGIFKDETVLDLDDLPGPVIAVVGENGHGKSTLCSAWGAAMYRKIATDHGVYPVGRFVTREDGFLEAVITVDGEPWRLYQNFGDEAAFVYRPDGTKVDERGMRSSFDRWAADNLLPREVRQAAFDAVQAEDGLLKVRRGERKRVLLNALGSAVLTKVGDASRKRADKEVAALERVAKQFEDRRAAAAKFPADLEALVTGARARLARADEDQAAARAGTEAHQRAIEVRRAAEAARAEHRETCARCDRLHAQRNELLALTKEADAIRTAAARVTELDAEAAQVKTALGEADIRASNVLADVTRAEREAASARKRAEAARATSQRAAAMLEDRWRILEAEAAVPILAQEVEKATAEHRRLMAAAAALEQPSAFFSTAVQEGEKAISDLDRELEAMAAAEKLEDPRLTAARRALGEAEDALRAFTIGREYLAERRIGILRTGLDETIAAPDIDTARAVAEGAKSGDDAAVAAQSGEARAAVEETVRAARTHLDAVRAVVLEERSRARADCLARRRSAAATLDEAKRTLADEARRARVAAAKSVEEAGKRLAEITAKHSKALVDAALGPALARAEGERAEADATAAREDEAARAADAQAASFREQGAQNGAEAARLRGELERLRAERAVLAPAAGRLDALIRAEGSLAALVTPLAEAEAAVLAGADAVAGPLPTVPAAPDIRAAEAEVRAASTQLAVLEEQARAAAAVAAEVAALEERVADARVTVATWQLLADAFGPDGIQALEIDAACPALSELATGYLHRHFGPRWSIRVDTREEDDDGEGAGVLNITVLDAEEDRREDILFFSPGERAFLGRAFAGALAFLVCSRLGASESTLVLDETAGAVSPGNLEPYMAMIRGIAADIGASRVMLVVHSPPLAALADSVIRVEHGTLSFKLPGLDA